MRNDGSHVTQLTKGDSQETHPEWASDNTIYFGPYCLNKIELLNSE
jgi:hypothetical protein